MGIGNSKTPNLTQNELELIQQSWKIIMENREENGIFVLKTFLDKYNYYSKFKKFSGIPIETLPETQLFRNHASSIIEMINQIILEINNSSSLKNKLHSLGSFHAKNKITENEFENFKETVIDILENHFRLPEGTLSAWRKIFNIVFVYVFEGLKAP